MTWLAANNRADAHADAPGAGVRFWQADANVDLTCNAPSVVQHAVATLYAYDASPTPHTRLGGWRVTIDPAALLDAAALQAAAETASALDVGRDLIAHVLPSPQGDLYWLPAKATAISVNREARVAAVRCSTEPVARFWAPRLVRQAMTAQMLAAGAVYAHAAAFAVDKRGVLITGHRGDGKTTALLAGLRHVGGNLITNDRILLRAEPGGITGYPWPIHVRAGIGTLLAATELADLVPAGLRALPTRQRWHQPDKLRIQPHTLVDRLGSGEIADTCRVALMIWPKITPGHRGASAELVPTDEVADALIRTRMFMLDPSTGARSRINHWLFPTPPASQTMAQLHAIVRTLATTVPCYRVRAGHNLEALSRQIGDLLAQTANPPIRGPGR